MPSISAIFETVQDRAADGDDVRVRYAEDDGHPTYVEINRGQAGTAGSGYASCLRITDYRAR